MTPMPERARAVILRVAAESRIKPEDIIGRSRKLKHVHARQRVMAELFAMRSGSRLLATYSLAQVGGWLGRHHSTVLYGAHQHAKRVGEGA